MVFALGPSGSRYRVVSKPAGPCLNCGYDARVNTPLASLKGLAQLLLTEANVKTYDAKIKRSALYHLINTIVPCNHCLRARFDLWGSVLVVGLTLSAITLARMFLALTH